MFLVGNKMFLIGNTLFLFEAIRMLLIGSDMFLVGSDMFFLRMEMALLGNYMLLPGNNMIHPEVLSTVGKLSKISILCGQTELLIKERFFNKTRSGYVDHSLARRAAKWLTPIYKDMFSTPST